MPPKREWPASKVSEYITPIATYAAPSELPRTTSKSRVFAVSSYGESTGKEKSIVVGGEWYFKPNGVAAVKTRFFKQLEKLGLAQAANLDWDDDQFVWVAVCYTNVVNVSRTLVHSIQDVVLQELPEALDYDSEEEDEYVGRADILEEIVLPAEDSSSCIARLSVWKRKHGSPEDDAGEGLFTVDIVEEPEPEINFQEFFDQFNATSVWQYMKTTENLAMTDVISSNDLEQILLVTGADCRMDPNNSRIIIGAPSEAICAKAYQKLSNVSKYGNMDSKHVSHIFYAEGDENVDYQLKYFTGVNSHFFVNTLLDNIKLYPGCNFDNLNAAITIRRAEWDTLKGAFVLAKVKITPATPGSEVEKPSRFWGGYVYAKIGTEETNPLREVALQGAQTSRVEELPVNAEAADQLGIPSILSEEKTTAVLGWVGEIPQTLAGLRRLENIPPNHPDPVTMVNKLKPKSPPPPSKAVKPSWDTYEEYDGRSKEIIARLKAEARGSGATHNDHFNQKSDNFTGHAKSLSKSPRKPLEQPNPQPNPSLPPARPSWSSVAAHRPRESLVDTTGSVETTISRPTAAAASVLTTSLSVAERSSPTKAPVRPHLRATPVKAVKSTITQASPVPNIMGAISNWVPPDVHTPPVRTRDRTVTRPSPVSKIMSASSPIPRDTQHSTSASTSGASTTAPRSRDLAAVLHSKNLDALEFKPSVENTEIQLSVDGSARLLPQKSPPAETSGQPFGKINLLDSSDEFRDESISALQQPLQPARLQALTTINLSQSLTGIRSPTLSSPASELKAIFRNLVSTAAEAVQSEDEVASRKFHQTMNQKAPKQNIVKGIGKNKVNPFHGRLQAPSPPRPTRQAPRPKTAVVAVDPLPIFVLQVCSEFEALIAPLRGHRGEIRVRLEFGRIILKGVARNAISREAHSTKSHNAEQLLHLLEPYNNVPFTYFSNILSTVAADMHFIMDMKSRSGEKLWDTDVKPVTNRVVYEFACHRDGALVYLPTSFELLANSGGGQHRLRQKRDYGQVNIHGTKRQWDTRITASGYQMEENIDPMFKQFGQEIIRSLYVPEQQIPFLAFKLENSLLEKGKLCLDGVRVHRIMEYRSTDKNSIMSISEIWELDVNGLPGVTHTIFKAEPNTIARPGREKVDYWNEVSISSASADKEFTENKSMEFGEEASWTPESLAQLKCVESMCRPACEMIKQMDGIGFWSDNGINEEESAPPVDNSPQTVPYQFW